MVKGKKITILGAARSGLAAAKMLKDAGAYVFVSDSASIEKKRAEAEELNAASIQFEFGRHSDRAYQADFVVLSPGIPVRSASVQKFVKNGLALYSEIEVAAWFCSSPVIAVTGSNGKTTTTTLIGEMLHQKYPQAIVAGNIGQPFSAYVQNSRPDSWAVVEVSSFQLETIDRFHPRQAVVLNFAPNHLDRYDGYEDYLRAKWRITKNLQKNDELIYNSADKKLSQWSEKINCHLLGFDINGNKKQDAYFDNKSIYIKGQELIAVSEMKLRGKHNYMNAMAAALAAANAGVTAEVIINVLKSFKGVEHRLEFVNEIDGVKYINDSKATTVESLSFALQSFNEPVVLIAGGKDKGSDFTQLNKLIQKHVKEVVLIGSATDKMEKAWSGIKPVQRAGTLDEAVQKAREIADTGDVALLSPACASFDMFIDFEDRGRKFKKIVGNLQD